MLQFPDCPTCGGNRALCRGEDGACHGRVDADPMWDRFDIVEAWYCFLSENYSGMGDKRYARLCKMDRYFSPRPNLSSATLGENARGIYDALVRADGKGS